jgi:hypothetical protein
VNWQIILALVIVIPVILFVPFMIWIAVISGLYQVARDRLRRRVTIPRRKAAKMATEPVVEAITKGE